MKYIHLGIIRIKLEYLITYNYVDIICIWEVKCLNIININCSVLVDLPSLKLSQQNKVGRLGYLMRNPLYTYILNIYDLVWLGFMAYQPL